jgi:hypothetical protein
MSIVLLAIPEARRSLPRWSEPCRWNRGLSTTNAQSWPTMATCRPQLPCSSLASHSGRPPIADPADGDGAGIYRNLRLFEESLVTPAVLLLGAVTAERLAELWLARLAKWLGVDGANHAPVPLTRRTRPSKSQQGRHPLTARPSKRMRRMPAAPLGTHRQSENCN